MRFPIVLLTLACACASSAPRASDAPSPVPQKVAFWKDSGHFEAYCRGQIGLVQQRRDALKGLAQRPGPEILGAYDGLLIAVDDVAGWASLLANVHPDQAMRSTAEQCERDLDKLVTELQLDPAVFTVLSAVRAENLPPEDRRFLKKSLEDFRRSGVDRSAAVRGELLSIQNRLTELGQRFRRNIRDDVRKISVDDPTRLKGLPGDFVRAHAPKDGKIVLTTNYPDYFPVQNYAEDRALRAELARAFLNRGYPQNTEVLTELLRLRRRYATLLGYETWADYMAADKMVKTGARIASFIESIERIARPRMEKDLKVLRLMLPEDQRNEGVQVWDRFFLANQVRRARFEYDAQAARRYFEYGRVTKGIMDLYAELFELKFNEIPGAEVWAEGVKAYELLLHGEVVGRFYLDMHPRPGKYGHAAMFPIHTGTNRGRAPKAALVCNFPDPAASSEPALMEHKQVVTYFHEFGHLMHQLLARRSRFVRLAGISVEWDFVEAPSQLLEEWAWSPKVLQRFALHHETKEPIPVALVERMKAAAEFGRGVDVMRQIYYAAMSYELHVQSPDNIDLDAVGKKLQTQYSPFPFVPGTHIYAGFGHLEGYSSMYYTYQWSLALAKDIFTRFDEAGIMDGETARAYRDLILAPGGSQDADELVRAFLGRKSQLDAYRAWLVPSGA